MRNAAVAPRKVRTMVVKPMPYSRRTKAPTSVSSTDFACRSVTSVPVRTMLRRFWPYAAQQRRWLPVLTLALLVAGGWLVWTFVEYWLHRGFFHLAPTTPARSTRPAATRPSRSRRSRPST